MARVVVVGGGAAGLMAAITVADRGIETLVIEHMPRPARKLMITGKGRCNVTNNTDSDGLIKAVTKNSKFMFSAFSEFSASDTMEFFETHGVPLKTERGNRVFPVSNKAVDVVDVLVSTAKRQNVKFITAKAVDLKIVDGVVMGVECENGAVVECDAVILATGGASYPLTGSIGIGYKIAEKAGHTIEPLVPSIVPLEARNGWVSDLMGLSLKNISVKVIDNSNQKRVFSDFGELMFTHFGLSGPVVLSASAHMRKLPKTTYNFQIDLKPALTPEQLDARILKDFQKYNNRIFLNALCDLLPKKMVPVAVKLSKIPPSQKVNSITKQQRMDLLKVLKSLTVEIIDFRPIEEAVVTSGGIKVSEINPKTMESKKIKNLYFAGEIIDVDAYTGGYNLQIAFSTGVCAGKYVLGE